MNGGELTEAKKLLSYQEAADYLGIKKSTLQTMVCQRRVECVKVGRRVYFTRSALTSFIERNTRKPMDI